MFQLFYSIYQKRKEKSILDVKKMEKEAVYISSS